MTVYGVDIGTTAVGAVAVGADGAALASVSVPHCADLAGRLAGVDEQDPLKLIAAAERAVDELRGRAGRDPDAFGWTGQMHGVAGVDDDLRPVTPYVTWRDSRRFAGRVMEGWAREGRRIHRCLPAPGLAMARFTGRCGIDETFLHSWHLEGREFPRDWLPPPTPREMIGDNQAGVFAAQRIAPGSAVVNIGTSGQLSVLGEGTGGERRPYPGGGVLRCRASLVGGQALARLRERLGLSWAELNLRAADPRISACLRRIVADLRGDVDLGGVSLVVGVGNALRLNPALRREVELELGMPCEIPEVPEMAAYGAALFALENLR